MAARAAGSDDDGAGVTPAMQCERIQARLLNPKQGKDSVGVQRHYSGPLGKIGNCQIGVSLTIATKHEHVPVDFALYMPASVDRRPPRGGRRRGFPSTSLHARSRTRSMGEIVPADAAYGASSVFRNTVRIFGLDLGVAVTASMMWLVIEWPEGQKKPTKFVLTTHHLPRRMPKKQIVRIFKECWRTERAYEELKGELKKSREVQDRSRSKARRQGTHRRWRHRNGGFSVDTDEYSADYPKKQWSYLAQGVMINFQILGLIHYSEEDQELELILTGQGQRD